MSSLLSYIKKVSSHGDNSRGDASPYEEDCCGLQLEEWHNYNKSLSIDALLKLSFIHLHFEDEDSDFEDEVAETSRPVHH